MLTGGTEGTMYEIANEVFDEVVFSAYDDLDAYNAGPETLRDELYEIVGEMIAAAEQAMVDCARANKERFLKMVREETWDV